MSDQAAVVLRPNGERLLTNAEFQTLADVPPEVEWFANLENLNTRRAYQNDLGHFMRFTGIVCPAEFRAVTRAHVIAWRKELEQRALSPASIRRKLSALSDLFDFLCDSNAIAHNPVKGVKRPTEGANEGKTPALSDAQAKRLLETPDGSTLKGKRDRAILAVLLYHALRRAELCSIREGVSPEYLHKSGGWVGFGHAARVAHRICRRDLSCTLVLNYRATGVMHRGGRHEPTSFAPQSRNQEPLILTTNKSRLNWQRLVGRVTPGADAL